MNEKETGSFYTPQKLIEYMINYVSSRVDPKSILEPSAGDGRFACHLKQFNASIWHHLTILIFILNAVLYSPKEC